MEFQEVKTVRTPQWGFSMVAYIEDIKFDKMPVVGDYIYARYIQ